MGHNFNMEHDGTDNDCTYSYIMSPTSNSLLPGYTPNEFSTCSVEYLEEYFYTRTQWHLQCAQEPLK